MNIHSFKRMMSFDASVVCRIPGTEKSNHKTNIRNLTIAPNTVRTSWRIRKISMFIFPLILIKYGKYQRHGSFAMRQVTFF
jgi:hypothetical protein